MAGTPRKRLKKLFELYGRASVLAEDIKEVLPFDEDGERKSDEDRRRERIYNAAFDAAVFLFDRVSQFADGHGLEIPRLDGNVCPKTTDEADHVAEKGKARHAVGTQGPTTHSRPRKATKMRANGL